jgi:hypothetical protein
MDRNDRIHNPMKMYNFGITFYADPWQVTNWENVSYFVYQQEKCPTTGRIHFQAYLEVLEPMKSYELLMRLRLLGLKACHIECPISSRTAMREYCMKTNTRADGAVVHEFGFFKDDEMWEAFNTPGHLGVLSLDL